MWQNIKTWWRRAVLDKPYKPGKILHDYSLQAVLGMGSYGIAYKAVHQPTGQLCVLKQVRPSLRRTPKGEVLQQYEQKVLAALNHPRMPRWRETFRYRNDSFLVMSYIEGPTLEELLFDRQMSIEEAEAASLIKQVGELVVYLHERKIIHRDVRIPNVIWNDGQPHLIDFGLARFIGDSPTYSGKEIAYYPEEKQLKRQVEPASDLYALGHFFLFLLYSGYVAEPDQPERSWEEELTLTPAIRQMLRRLLQIDTPYNRAQEWLDELNRYIETTKSSSPAG
ncbi:serine/threonine protein kinase [Brevibacillus sp. H7]|uniref:serine/threonine protein kinase n=1 Tax=Brevibacillus sp. H7 TaxID=3349138 RepID=UPI003829255F